MYFVIFLYTVFVDEVEAEEEFVGNKFEVGVKNEVEVGYCDTEGILDVNLNKQSKQICM